MSIRFHDKNDPMKGLKLTKRAKAKGKLHTWTLSGKDPFSRIVLYRCLVCDFFDTAEYPHTPEPRQPYCPAERENSA